jgi:hypothetical protein
MQPRTNSVLLRNGSEQIKIYDFIYLLTIYL